MACGDYGIVYKTTYYFLVDFLKKARGEGFLRFCYVITHLNIKPYRLNEYRFILLCIHIEKAIADYCPSAIAFPHFPNS
ncbi:MAG: hypothetical protein MET45_05185 [Nostoc sp. LLA-1]|nr:hypothetical protein [Cyanocohniella sp. LLY]